MSIRLSSVLRVEVGLSEGRAPFFIQRWMGNQHGGLSIPTEESWPGLIESLLVGFEAILGQIELRTYSF